MAYVISSLRKSQHQSQTDWLSFSHVLLNCWDAFVACCMPSAMIPFIIVMIIFRDLWWPPHFSVWPLLAAFSMGWHLAKPLISFTPLALTLEKRRLRSSWEFREVESIRLLCCLQQDLSFIFYPFNNSISETLLLVEQWNCKVKRIILKSPTDLGRLMYSVHFVQHGIFSKIKILGLQNGQNCSFWPSNIAKFDFIFYMKSECHKVKIWESLTLLCVQFSPKIRIQDLQNDQNCRFISPKIAKFDFT